MRLEGSCHCGAVRFALEAGSPVPYLRCYCSICRKTAGGGGYAINLGAAAASLEVSGEEHLSVYRARTESHGEPSEARPNRFIMVSRRKAVAPSCQPLAIRPP